jgi:alkanesulfonate monooxygenase SsuD/methylene tetrahydromethanopterin reductase-like flavin-dependent oxidoreductase (luciferase family)
VRVGITVPQFRHDADPAVEVARRAEAAGLDGVFAFDHFFPLNQPERPAIHGPTLLGALATETERVAIGTFMARVGVVPDAVLVHTLLTLHRMAGDRLIAGLGVGDAASREETRRYGIADLPAADRLARLAACCDRLGRAGVRTWVGGLSEGARAVAAEHATAWNCWGVDLDSAAAGAADLRARGSGGVEATWGGQVLVSRTVAEAEAKRERHGDRPGLVRGTVADLARHLEALAAAGITWAVCSPLDVGDDPAGAVGLLAEVAASVSDHGAAGHGPAPPRR